MPYKDRDKHNAMNRRVYAADADLRARRAEYQRRYRAINRDKVNARARKNRYSATPAVREYRARYWQRRQEQRAGRPMPALCELCGLAPRRKLALDHDHETGKFRGWLCIPCNTSLGKLGDNVAGLERAIAYLRRAA